MIVMIVTIVDLVIALHGWPLWLVLVAVVGLKLYLLPRDAQRLLVIDCLANFDRLRDWCRFWGMFVMVVVFNYRGWSLTPIPIKAGIYRHAVILATNEQRY